MLRTQPIFMMRGYSPEDMPNPWSLSGHEAVRRPLRVRILSPSVNPQQQFRGPVCDQTELERAFCPDVMEEIVTDYLRNYLEEPNGVRRQNGQSGVCEKCPCAPTTARKEDCCGEKSSCGTGTKCNIGKNAGKCQNVSRQCPEKESSCGRRQTPNQTPANPMGPSTSTSPSRVQRQSQPETVSLDTLLEHVFGEIFGHGSRDERDPADDGVTTNTESGDKHPKTTGYSDAVKLGKETSNGNATEGEQKPSNKSDKPQRETKMGENQGHSGAMSLHDVLGIMFTDLLGSQRCESNDKCCQNDATNKRTCKSPSSHPQPADVENVSQSSTRTTDGLPVHDQLQHETLELQTQPDEEAPDSHEDDIDIIHESNQYSESAPLMPVAQDVPSHNNVKPEDVGREPEQFRTTFDLNGFSPDDIKVSLAQDKLTVKASRETTENGLTTEHSIQRSLTLPPGVDSDSLRCRLDDDGHMTVSADYIHNNKGQTLLTIEKVTEN